jgi:hypothetical protein
MGVNLLTKVVFAIFRRKDLLMTNEYRPRTSVPLLLIRSRPWSRSVHARGFPQHPRPRSVKSRVHAHITLMRHGIRRSSAPNSDLSVNIQWIDGWRPRRPLVW